MLLARYAIRPNAAKGGLVKLCFYSLLGKLAERRNRTQTKLISEPQELYWFLATPVVEVMNLMLASERFVWASRRYTAEKQAPSLRHTNEFVAAYVARGGQMQLYAYREKLGERALL